MHGVGSTGFVACPWWLIVQRVAEKMVAKPRREQRSSSPLGIALVAASCLFFVVRRGSEFCNGWLKNGSSVSGTGAGKELSRLALAAPRVLFGR